MYKLTIIAGPGRGTSYGVQDGEISIGRQPGNVVVLQSTKISKRHCTLVVNDEEVVLRDEGSANGTFVNGVLTRMKTLVLGDRISVGEYVLELTEPRDKISLQNAPALRGMGLTNNLIHFPQQSSRSPMGSANAQPFQGYTPAPMTETAATPAMPTDIKGKLIWQFDHLVMPFFYSLNLRNEWRLVCAGLVAVFVLANLVISVYPLSQSSHDALVKEVGKRAQFMARQIVERNAPAIAGNAETKTEVGSVEKEEGVRVAVLTDLENRILAPAAKMNTYLTSGDEANMAIRARDLFRKGREVGFVGTPDASTVVAIEPLKIYNPQVGRNLVVGMAIVSIDTTMATPDAGEMGVVYSETLILTGLLAMILFFILYRLTLKPLHVLNDDIDKVLKGDMSQVTREFKFAELDSLWDVLNSALQRVQRGGAPGSAEGGFGGDLGSVPAIDEFVGALRVLGELSKFGLVVCDADRKIVYMNGLFEEISGIRADGAIGQDLPGVARDQAFGPFSSDLFDRAQPGGSAANEDFDFSGITYKMFAAAIGASGASAKGFILAAMRQE